jgi:hypothetical protein
MHSRSGQTRLVYDELSPIRQNINNRVFVFLRKYGCFFNEGDVSVWGCRFPLP